MARLVSLHVGVSANDGHAGPLGTALGAAAAAQAMADIVREVTHRHPAMLVDGEAKLDVMMQAFHDLTCPLQHGDLFVLTLAGHGLILDGLSDDGCEKHDQAMVLWDDYLVDNDLHELCRRIGNDIDVVVVADGCFTGSILTNLSEASFKAQGDHAVEASLADDRGRDCDPRQGMTANVLLLAATSSTGIVTTSLNGGVPPLTRAIVDNWHDAKSYVGLMETIQEKLPRAGINSELLKNGSELPYRKPFVLT